MTEKNLPKILLVEDEINVGSTLTEQLELEGYQLSWAKNFQDAKFELENRKFDLILLDIGLPDGSGHDLARLAKIKNGSASIIFLTAMGTPEDRVKGLELGAEDYIVKPFYIKELLLRVQNGLKRSNYLKNADDEIQIGKAKVRFPKNEIEVNHKVHSLTQKESALLKFLIERKGAVVSRDEILNFIWSEDEYPSPRTVDNFILKLRKILEEDPHNQDVIKSIRGVGYQLTFKKEGA